MTNKLVAFWRQHPALFIGLHLLMGMASSLCWHWTFAIVLGLLWFPLFSSPKKLAPYLVLTVGAFVYTHLLYPSISLPQKQEGTAYVSISSLKTHASPFQRSFQYEGHLHAFLGKEMYAPCKIYVSSKGERPLANSDYLISGMVTEKSPRHYLLKPSKDLHWQKVSGTFSLAETRYKAKEWIRSHLKKELPNPRSSSFLCALLLGDLDDRALSLEFGHLGLQHILAISGFHFALLAAFFGFFLKLILPERVAAASLLAILSSYALFIGGAPSVQRGWTALAIMLLAKLLRLRTSGMNALGVGLIIALLSNPLTILNLGFQLSFTATAAILLLYPTINRLFSYVLPKRKLSAVASMTTLDQHGAILSALIRQGMALNFSVLLFALPTLLFTFHKFPLLSLIYNLFVPFWTACVFLMLLLTIPLMFFIPPLASLLHQINSSVTAALLELTAHPPAILDFSLRVHSFSYSLLICLLTMFFFSGILMKKQAN